MDLLTLRIPLAFVQAKLRSPSWRDIQFGLEQQLLAPEAVIELAAQQLDQPEPPEALVDLGTLDPGAPLLGHIRELADMEPSPPDRTIADRWLFLVLAWLFEHRNELRDPLETLETVYADFDYPEELASFVRYMPSEEPDLGDPKLNAERLVHMWEAFLSAQAERFTPR